MSETTASAPASVAQPQRKVHIETWGCQMNTADSERMLALLAERNYTLATGADDADLVLLNTCHIREKARHKVLSRLGVLRDLKDKNPDLRIAVAGCVAQADGARLLKEAPQIDVLFGPGKIDELPRLLDEQSATGRSAYAVGFRKDRGAHDDAHAALTPAPTVTTPSVAPPTLTGKNEISRYVNIQQGCNNYCTFCVVPFTRGRELSRTPAEILAEARDLVAGGARELTVLGQNVNSYGLDLVDAGRLAPSPDGPFVDLLRAVAALPGLDRLRFTTSNPQNFTPALARLFADEPKMGRYLHLPVQSGDDEVLTRMKRKVTAAEFLERVSWLKAAIPDIAISTDLIVGFPGETDAQFESTLALVEQVRFSFAFTFKYSPRRNTPAARYGEQLSEAVKDERLARLNALQDRLTVEHNLAEIGQIRPVLFHYESKKNPGHYYGRTEHFRLVRVPSPTDLVGQCLPVTIVDANKTALIGSLA
jgi:tRNA-2-methylthio-N6-dimethylallyladenosine synthase